MLGNLLVAAFSPKKIWRGKVIFFDASFFDVRLVFASLIARYLLAESNFWFGLNENGVVLSGMRHLLKLRI